MSASGTFLSLAVIVLAIVGAHAVARLWAGRAEYLTALGTCTFALVVASAHVVGVVAAVTRRPVLTSGALALATAGVSLVAWRVSESLRRRLATVSVPPPGGKESPAEPRRRWWRSRGFVAAAVGCSAYLANAVVLAVSAPPRGWDVLTYHLPRAVAWLQHGNLGHYGFSPAYYPGNAEIAILLALFSGTDRLAPLVQLPFALLGSVALYGLARELGARARSAAIAVAAFLLSPIVFFQSAIAKNDLIVTALCVSAVYVLCRSLRRDRSDLARRLDVGLAGLAFGLALGTKYTAAPFALSAAGVVFVSAVWLARQGRNGRNPSPWRAAVSFTALFAGAVALPSVFWLAQNWITVGNPFAPFAVGVGKWKLFSGLDAAAAPGEQLNYVTHAAEWWWFPWIDGALAGTYSGSAGFGAAFAAFGVPALALLLWRSLRRAHDRVKAASLVVAVMIAVWTAAWWFGGHHLPRFLLPVVALTCAPIPLAFDAAGRTARKALLVLFVAALAFSSAETMRIVYVARDFMSSRLPSPTKAEYYNVPDIIYELPPRTGILLLQIEGEDYHRTFRYPLVGNLPGNEVIMADDVGVRLEEAIGDPEAMHAALRREGVEYIFARTLFMMPKDTWFDGYPDLYVKVVDTIEMPYPWHRAGFVRQRADGRYEGLPVVTKMYRVIQTP